MGTHSQMIAGQEYHEDSEPMEKKIKCAECMKEMQPGEKTFDASKWMFEGAEVCVVCFLLYTENDEIQEGIEATSASPILSSLFADMAEVFSPKSKQCIANGK